MEVEFKILNTSSLKTLEDEINKYLEDGFELHGVLFIDRDTTYKNYCQAVVKYKHPPCRTKFEINPDIFNSSMRKRIG